MSKQHSIDILTHFPSKDDPRPEQIKVLKSIQDALDEKYKFIIIQAPTGSGKSHIAATLAASSNPPNARIINLIDSYTITKTDPIDGPTYENEVLSYEPYGCAVMTVSKSLQDQYQSLFSSADILKGKQNYICKVDEDFDCDLAPCLLTPKIMDECKKVNRCPMLNARRAAWKSKFGVFNYSSFLHMSYDFLKRRQFFVCDEASELEDELVKSYSCDIEYSRLNLSELNIKRLHTNLNGDAFKWLTDLSVALKDKINENEQELIKSNKKHKRILMGKLVKNKYYKSLHEKTTLVLQNWYKAEYITEIDKDRASFTPLYVNVIAQDFFSSANTVILMSGTIIDHETFANTLGIAKGKYKYIEIESGFDAKKSPIYCDVKTKLNYRNLDKALPLLTTKALKICEHFEKDKGIIHTHSFKITEAMLKRIKGNNRFLVREAGVTNENILAEHYLRDDSTVVISPSLGFGTDLRDGFGRFSIIMKTPYLPLNSERIKRLAQKNQKWYEMKALVNLVQMCGRTTRNKEDYSDTFILDGTAIDLIKRNKNKMPKYFIDRIH